MASRRVHTLDKCPPVHISSLELPAFIPFVHEVIKNTNVCMLFMPCDPLKFPTVPCSTYPPSDGWDHVDDLPWSPSLPCSERTSPPQAPVQQTWDSRLTAWAPAGRCPPRCEWEGSRRTSECLGIFSQVSSGNHLGFSSGYLSRCLSLFQPKQWWGSFWKSTTQIKNINVGIMYMYYTEWTEYSLPFLSKYCLFCFPWSLPVEPWWAPRMSWQQQWSVLTSQLLLSFTFCPSVSWPDCLHWRPVPAVPQSPGRPQ